MSAPQCKQIMRKQSKSQILEYPYRESELHPLHRLTHGKYETSLSPWYIVVVIVPTFATATAWQTPFAWHTPSRYDDAKC